MLISFQFIRVTERKIRSETYPLYVVHGINENSLVKCEEEKKKNQQQQQQNTNRFLPHRMCHTEFRR